MAFHKQQLLQPKIILACSTIHKISTLARLSTILNNLPYGVPGKFAPYSSKVGKLLILLDISQIYCSSTFSPLYLANLPVWRSNACVNWLIGGGTFRRCFRIASWRWRRMYLGHRTKRLRSRFGWMSCPIMIKKSQCSIFTETSLKIIRMQPFNCFIIIVFYTSTSLLEFQLVWLAGHATSLAAYFYKTYWLWLSAQI